MSILKMILFIGLGELIIHLLLYLISKLIGKSNKDKVTWASVVKGVLERAFVTITLYFDLVSAITLLGALKIATRLKDQEDRVTNDFFLIGNLLSVLLGILYYVLISNKF